MAKNGKLTRDDLDNSNCHCEEQRDEAISLFGCQLTQKRRDCFVAALLAMTRWVD